MRKDIHKTGEPKARYRVKNWAAYNAGLINRGNVTIWIDEAVLARIPDAIPTRSRPCLYGDALIEALLGVKTVYRLTVPNYTTFFHRAKRLIRTADPSRQRTDPFGCRQHRSEGLWRR
ncbi:MAG: IS5 family transposase ISBam3 [Burkholderia gladioli]|nr:MAG: IS5 family transposase ISBam3 [Burkholderia gladioli]